MSLKAIKTELRPFFSFFFFFGLYRKFLASVELAD